MLIFSPALRVFFVGFLSTFTYWCSMYNYLIFHLFYSMLLHVPYFSTGPTLIAGFYFLTKQTCINMLNNIYK